MTYCMVTSDSPTDELLGFSLEELSPISISNIYVCFIFQFDKIEGKYVMDI